MRRVAVAALCAAALFGTASAVHEESKKEGPVGKEQPKTKAAKEKWEFVEVPRIEIPAASTVDVKDLISKCPKGYKEAKGSCVAQKKTKPETVRTLFC